MDIDSNPPRRVFDEREGPIDDSSQRRRRKRRRRFLFLLPFFLPSPQTHNRIIATFPQNSKAVERRGNSSSYRNCRRKLNHRYLLARENLLEAKEEWNDENAEKSYKEARRKMSKARHEVAKTRKHVRIEFRILDVARASKSFRKILLASKTRLRTYWIDFRSFAKYLPNPTPSCPKIAFVAGLIHTLGRRIP